MTQLVSPQGDPLTPASTRGGVPGHSGVLHPIARALLFVLVWFSLWLWLPGVVYRWTAGWSGMAQQALAYVLLDAALLAESWLFVKAFDRRSFRIVGLWFYPGWGSEFAYGAGIGAALLTILVGALAALRALAYHGLADLGGRDVLGLVAIAGLLLLAAVFEELTFRGYGYQRMLDGAGPLVGTAVFAAGFGAVHLTNPSATALSTANTALSGLLLALAYLKTRGLWLPIGLHWAWNFFMGPVFSLPVSGLHLGPTLLRSEMRGATWLSGGAYGPEGGVVLTAICVAAAVGLARTRRISPSRAMQEVIE